MRLKSITVTYCECVLVTLGNQHALRIRHIDICGLPGSTKLFPHSTARFLETKKKKLY